MASSKGKPTDPKLREQIKKDVQNETNKDGTGKGSWSAWKGSKLSKEYEKQGGGYENEAGSKNEPKKGPPQEKSGKKKERELKEGGNDEGEGEKDVEETEDEKLEEKPKANSGKKAVGRPKGTGPKTKKADKPKAEGTRRSARIGAGSKRYAADDDDDEEEEAAPVKKAKTGRGARK